MDVAVTTLCPTHESNLQLYLLISNLVVLGIVVWIRIRIGFDRLDQDPGGQK